MDDDEFIEWVAGHQRQLLRSAYLLTGDLQRAQDLVQEALVKVALRWPRLRSGNPAAYARTDHRPRQHLLVAPAPPRGPGRRAPARRRAVSSDPETALVVRRCARPADRRASARWWCCGTSTT